jgi:hypothetical protein
MFLSHQTLPLKSIGLSTEWNLHPWELNVIPTELQESFNQNGVIHPPIVIANSDKTFVIVSGARRVEFFRKTIGPSHIDCMVVEKGAPHSLILNLILIDQSCAFELSLAEKARFVEIASRLLKIEDIVTAFLGKLKLKNGRSTIPNLLKILQQDETIIREIHSGRLQDRMVSEILSLPKETDRVTLVQLFMNLGMGGGKQKRFFNLIRDIAFREGSTISAYLQKEEITAILNHNEMNVPQKIHHLGNLLQQAMTPASALAEGAFVKQVTSLQLPTSHSISHSPSFEKDEITLSITFKDFVACEHYLSLQQKQSR